MKTLLGLLALSLVLVPSGDGLARQQSQPSAAEAEVIALERRIADAYARGDASRLEDLLADDMVYVDVFGRKNDRKSLLGEVNSLKGATLTFDFSSLGASVFGDTAVATGKYDATGRTPDGQTVGFDEVFTDVFVKRGGKWVLVENRRSFPQAGAGGPSGERTAKVRDAWGTR